VLFGLFVREAFSTRISPEARRLWALAAGVLVAGTAVALWRGVVFAGQLLPG